MRIYWRELRQTWEPPVLGPQHAVLWWWAGPLQAAG
jgi:hypothetical protein